MLWSLKEYKRLFLVVGVVGILTITSPMLVFLVPSQTSEQFSELYYLGPNHMAEDIPFNIEAGLAYTVNLHIVNHQGLPSYYLVSIKLRNQTDALPNSTTSLPSPLPAIVEPRVFLGDADVWERPLTFSVQALPLPGNYCVVETLAIDGSVHDVGTLVAWDQEHAGYFVELFFELWLFNLETQTFAFHNRWVGLWLNVTCQQQ